MVDIPFKVIIWLEKDDSIRLHNAQLHTDTKHFSNNGKKKDQVGDKKGKENEKEDNGSQGRY